MVDETFGKCQTASTNTAFTLAEVLITLTIVGAVAALTIPTLMQNIQKTIWATQLKTTYTILNEGFRSALAIEGVESFADTDVYAAVNTSTTNEEEAAYTTRYMQKYFKNITATGYYEQVAAGVATGTKTGDTCKTWTGTGYLMYYYIHDNNTCQGWRQHNYKLINGAILNMAITSYPYYNYEEYDLHPNVSGPIKQIVGTITVDINGTKGPNTWGRDAFQFYLGQDGILYALGGEAYALYFSQVFGEDYGDDRTNVNYDDCSPTTPYRGDWCTAKIIDDGWKMNY